MKGFTLIEILIALFISTLVLFITFTGLQSLINIQHKLHATQQRLSGLQTTFWHCQQDLAQYNNAFLRDAYSSPLPSFNLQPTTLSFVTARYHQYNATYPTTSILHVAYQLTGDTLYRITYPIENAAFQSLSFKQALLKNVNKIKFLALNNKNSWVSNLTISDNTNDSLVPKVKAVELIIYTNHMQVHRIFPIDNPIITGGAHV